MRRIIFTDSSNVASAAWHGDVLEVTFSSGATYQYKNVQLHQFGELAASASAGKWVHATLVKHPDAYPCEKVQLDQSLDELVRARQALGLIASAPPSADASALRQLALETIQASLARKKEKAG